MFLHNKRIFILTPDLCHQGKLCQPYKLYASQNTIPMSHSQLDRWQYHPMVQEPYPEKFHYTIQYDKNTIIKYKCLQNKDVRQADVT